LEKGKIVDESSSVKTTADKEGKKSSEKHHENHKEIKEEVSLPDEAIVSKESEEETE
jgi:hypothetical protein